MTTYARFSSSPVTIAFTTLLAAITACTAVDDDPSEPAEADSDTDDLTPGEECRAAAEDFMCTPLESFFYRSGDGQPQLTWVDVDDPDATVELPGGVLVEVSSATEFVGSHYFGNDFCSVGCSWCEPGRSLCYTNASDPGGFGCGTCIAFDTPNIVEECAELLEACQGRG